MYEMPEAYVAPEKRCQQPNALHRDGVCGRYAETTLVGRRTCWECADSVRVLKDAIDRLSDVVLALAVQRGGEDQRAAKILLGAQP